MALAGAVNSRVVGTRALLENLVLQPRGQCDDTLFGFVLLEEFFASLVGGNRDGADGKEQDDELHDCYVTYDLGPPGPREPHFLPRLRYMYTMLII